MYKIGASQFSFITETMVNKLRIWRRNYISLREINNMASGARYSVNIQLCSWYSKFRAQVMCFILPKFTWNVPALYIEHDSCRLSTNLFYVNPGLLIKMCVCWSEQNYSFIYPVQADTVATGEFPHSKKLKWAGFWRNAQHIQGSHINKQRHNF
jgi:hypothetical protein